MQEDQVMSNPKFEADTMFCSNQQCALHVRPGMPGIRESGNWALLANGLWIGRGIYNGRMRCDACGLEQPPVTRSAA
jgi:hypothetical protein